MNYQEIKRQFNEEWDALMKDSTLTGRQRNNAVKEIEKKYIEILKENNLPHQVENYWNLGETVEKKVEKKESSEEDVFAQLEKLASLKDKGIITEEEFAEKKKKLLDL